MWIRGGGGKTLIHKMWIICRFLLLNPSLRLSSYAKLTSSLEIWGSQKSGQFPYFSLFFGMASRPVDAVNKRTTATGVSMRLLVTLGNIRTVLTYKLHNLNISTNILQYFNF